MSHSSCPTVSVCYSREDAQWLRRMRVHLDRDISDGVISLWDDTKIEPGADRGSEVDKALRRAKIVVLLVSADFLASPFVRYKELKELLERISLSGGRELSVFPILVGPADIPAELSRFQFINRDGRSLKAMSDVEREELWAGLATSIRARLNARLSMVETLRLLGGGFVHNIPTREIGMVRSVSFSRMFRRLWKRMQDVYLVEGCRGVNDRGGNGLLTDTVELDVYDSIPHGAREVYCALRDHLELVTDHMKNIENVEPIYRKEHVWGVSSGFVCAMNFLNYQGVRTAARLLDEEFIAMLMSGYQHCVWSNARMEADWTFQNPFFYSHGTYCVVDSPRGCELRMTGRLDVHLDRLEMGVEGAAVAAMYVSVRAFFKDLVRANMRQLGRGVLEYLDEMKS